MRPIEHIRRNVLDMTQTEIAALTRNTQPTVSRWEKGDLEPSLTEMNLIREEVQRRNLPWDDRWFFEVPAPTVAAA